MRAIRWRWVLLGVGLLALLMPAFVITGARLRHPTDARGIQLVACTTLALLYVLALAVTLGAVVRYRALLLVAVVPLLGAAVHAWWPAPSYLGGNPQPAASAVTRVLVRDGFRSVAELANHDWQPTWPSNGPFRSHGLQLPPLVQLDHVFVGPRQAGLGATTVALTGTAHRALIAQVAAT